MSFLSLMHGAMGVQFFVRAPANVFPNSPSTWNGEGGGGGDGEGGDGGGDGGVSGGDGEGGGDGGGGGDGSPILRESPG